MSVSARSFRFAFLAALVGAAVPAGLAGQSIWIDPGLESAVFIESLKPNLEGEGSTFTTSVHFLGLRLPAGDRFRLVAEVPFAYGDVKEDVEELPEGVDKATLGNPYLGIEWRSGPSSPFHAEIGVRAPLASDLFVDETLEEGNFGTAVGLLTEFGNRAEAFAPDIVPVTALANYTWRAEPGVALRLRAGPALWIPTDGAEAELLAAYSAQLWYLGEVFSLGGGYVGRALVTAEDTSFGEATFNQVGASANLALGRFVPGVQFRVPLDEDDGVDFIAGLNLALKLR